MRGWGGGDQRNIWSSSSLVNTLCGRSGRGVVRYSLSLMWYSSLLRSHRTLNHQSHTNTAWLNCVPFGHRNDACRPSMSQQCHAWHRVSTSAKNPGYGWSSQQKSVYGTTASTGQSVPGLPTKMFYYLFFVKIQFVVIIIRSKKLHYYWVFGG